MAREETEKIQSRRKPNVMLRATGTYSRDQVRHEAAEAMGVRDEDINDKLVDALIEQNNKAAMRMGYLVAGVLLFAAVVVTTIVGGTFAFQGMGVNVGVNGDFPTEEATP